MGLAFLVKGFYFAFTFGLLSVKDKFYELLIPPKMCSLNVIALSAEDRHWLFVVVALLVP